MKKLSVLCLVFLLAGCATLFKGTKEEVSFGSNPVGAEIYIDGQLMGKTPAAFQLVTKKVYVIEFKLGDKKKTVNLNNQVGAGWIILDVLGGLLPIIVDAATGAWYSFDMKSVNVDLQYPIPMP
jgi:hypothetical protein